eukprot:2554202-Pleurochrysis_carterae.AAC.2
MLVLVGGSFRHVREHGARRADCDLMRLDWIEVAILRTLSESSECRFKHQGRRHAALASRCTLISWAVCSGSMTDNIFFIVSDHSAEISTYSA